MRKATLATSAALLLLGAGCESTFNDPPTIARPIQDLLSPPPDRQVQTLTVGVFDNPAKAAVRWRDIGSGMSDALARTLLNDGDFDVRIDAGFARQARSALTLAGERREKEFDSIRAQRPGVRYVLTGAVTDFEHTSELPASIRRQSTVGSRAEAIVAIRYDLIDLEEGEIVATDHAYGTAHADDEVATKDLYERVSFGSYVFWSTPLGRASEHALNQVRERLRRLVEPSNSELMIVSAEKRRFVEVQSSSRHLPVHGGVYYLYRRDDDGVEKAVYDPATGRAVEVRIRGSNGSVAQGHLVGQPPLTIELRGALVRPIPPDPLIRDPSRRDDTVTDATLPEQAPDPASEKRSEALRSRRRTSGSIGP